MLDHDEYVERFPDEDEEPGGMFVAVLFTIACWLIGLGIWKAVDLLRELFAAIFA